MKVLLFYYSNVCQDAIASHHMSKNGLKGATKKRKSDNVFLSDLRELESILPRLVQPSFSPNHARTYGMCATQHTFAVLFHL